MPNKTHRALPRYKISDFFRSLLEFNRLEHRAIHISVKDNVELFDGLFRQRCELGLIRDRDESPNRAVLKCDLQGFGYGGHTQGTETKGLAGCGKSQRFCNEVARGASYWACEELISSRDMFLATFRRSSGYAKIIRCGRSARW